MKLLHIELKRFNREGVKFLKEYIKDNMTLYKILLDYFVTEGRNKLFKIKQINGETVGVFESISHYTNNDGVFLITIQIGRTWIYWNDIRLTNNITVYNTGAFLRDDIKSFFDKKGAL